jgi:hypothetical protein
MRPQTHVIYELTLVDKEGEEMFYEFSRDFDDDIYNSDIDGTDIMMVNFVVQDLKNEYGEELLLMEFSVDRSVVGELH